jgi:predicted alpha/beta-fold hydrolase
MSEFSPPFWLRNRHVQSIYPSFPLRRGGVERRAVPLLAASVEHILDCGDGVRLLGQLSAQTQRDRAPARQLVVMLHGWEGSSDSLYMVGLGQYLFERGYDIFRLNLRDHGPTHHLNRELFHSCRLPEAVGAVKRLQSLFPHQEFNLVGFSLGGNFALRIGARAKSAGIRLRRLVAISPVLEPEVTLESLERGLPVYRHYFVWKWRRSLLKKQLAWPGEYDFEEMLRTPTLTFMTDYLVRKYSEFPDLRTYLHGYAITRGALDSLEVSARIIIAEDDPMIPSHDLARLPRLPNLTVHKTKHGGHCGFFERLGGISWIAGQVLAELERESR